MIYIASFAVTFVAVFLKGFQHKNVIGGHLKTVFATSVLMAFFDVFSISIVISGGWTVAFSAGLGAGTGMVLAILTHDRIFRK
mgnify:CR=1 FL=1